MHQHFLRHALLACLVLIACSAYAEVTLPSIFGNHMVLQQGKVIPVWGKAAPGEKVTVSLAGTSMEATADGQGKWIVHMPKLKAGQRYEMTITGKDNSIKISDILTGEVWVGSGQSNMQWATKDTNNAQEEIAAANYQQIRLFFVELKAAQEPQENCKGEWKICTPENVSMFSAVLYYFGRDLHKALITPIGLIETCWGGTPAEAWTCRSTLEADPDLAPMVKSWDQLVADYPKAKEVFHKELADWNTQAEKAKAAGQPEPPKPKEPTSPESPNRPASLFNAMINPIVPFAIQGAIWYQGESNAPHAYLYRKLFPTMIKNWRRVWNQGDFPFYFVQLANFTDPPKEPGDSDWAELREAQTMTLALPKTGMAVAIDIGEAKDIHPRNKQEVGKRLALNALAKTYDKPVEFSGPMYKNVKIKNGKATVAFDHAKGLNVKGNHLTGFAIAGADKKFVWANAEIKGKTVVVWADAIKDPVAVRYGWANNPPCNLYNGVGLPASPFRTDDWPGITADKH